MDGNTTASEDEDSIPSTVKSETFDEECFKVLGASEKCAACNKYFETSHQCYEHMFLSKSQCYENVVSNLIKCGLGKDWNAKNNTEDSWTVVVVHSKIL